MRPRFSAADQNRTTCSTAALNRWTHQVGVTGGMRDGITPTRNRTWLARRIRRSAGDGRAKSVAFHPPPSRGREPFCEDSSMTNPDPNARPPFRKHPYYYPILKGVVLVCAAYFAARALGYL